MHLLRYPLREAEKGEFKMNIHRERLVSRTRCHRGFE